MTCLRAQYRVFRARETRTSAIRGDTRCDCPVIILYARRGTLPPLPRAIRQMYIAYSASARKNLADFAHFFGVNSSPRVDLMPGCLSMDERIFLLSLECVDEEFRGCCCKFHSCKSRNYLEVKAGNLGCINSSITRLIRPIFVRVTNNFIFHYIPYREDLASSVYPQDGRTANVISSKSGERFSWLGRGRGVISEGNRYVSVIKRQEKPNRVYE